MIWGVSVKIWSIQSKLSPEVPFCHLSFWFLTFEREQILNFCKIIVYAARWAWFFEIIGFWYTASRSEKFKFFSYRKISTKYRVTAAAGRMNISRCINKIRIENRAVSIMMIMGVCEYVSESCQKYNAIEILELEFRNSNSSRNS